jgi:hypothetical protein
LVFQKTIDLGQKKVSWWFNALEKSELNKIIGESYFNLKQYSNAILLVAYKSKRKWTTQILPIRLCALQTKRFENAISQFNKIIGGKILWHRNAYYHLGESYLNTDKKQRQIKRFQECI